MEHCRRIATLKHSWYKIAAICGTLSITKDCSNKNRSKQKGLMQKYAITCTDQLFDQAIL